MTIEIRSVTEKNINTFVDFPFELYRNHPYWVGELKGDTKKLLSPKNAFWAHAENRLFMAYKDGKPAGRIMALVNRLHNEYHQENIGFFGFFDCVHDQAVADALFAAAGDWLRSKKVTAVRGPANPSSNHVYGLLVDSFDSMPAIMMPYNEPYYAELIEKAGFSKIKDLLAFHRTKNECFSERFTKVCARCQRAKDITLRRLDLKNLRKEALIIRDIYNKSWADNWGFVPITEAEIMDMVDELKAVVRKEGTCVVEVNGVPAAFYIAIPNMNHALKELKGSLLHPWRLVKALLAWRKIKDARLIMLGVAPEFRHRGIDLILIKHIVDHGVSVWNEAELSWVLEDNEGIIRGIVECGCYQSKRYRLYQKSL